MEYQYGAYGYIGATRAGGALQSGTAAVYIGTAPVHLVRDYQDKGVINTPVKLTSKQDAQDKLGASQDFSAFTLMEAVAAHFDNPQGNVGPIYVINVLDPGVHTAGNPVQVELQFSAGRCAFDSDRIILDTFQLQDKGEGVDYLLDYDYARGKVLVSSADPEAPLTGVIQASYEEAAPEAVTVQDVIGGATESGIQSGLAALSLLYPQMGVTPNLLAAPGWSQAPEMYSAMVSASQRINGHWDAFVLVDMPIAEIQTPQAAVAWKNNHGYNHERSKVFWPQAVDAAGRTFHLSTLAAVEWMRADLSHGGVPMETCGNKPIPVLGQYFGGSARMFDQQASKILTSNGISTAVAWGGRWVLWGDHTAAYAYGMDVDPRSIFDVSMRMLMHITNSFQREWGPLIDKPMDRALKDRIINREQEKLDGYVSLGALVGRPSITFEQAENALSDRMNGDFRWDIAVTPTPPLKSASVYVAYTDAGFAAYFEEVK